IVVPSPQASLLPEEVEKLRRYMSDRNGRMVVLIDPGRRHGMDELFYDWGVLADDYSVIDDGPDYRAQGGDLIIRRLSLIHISPLCGAPHHQLTRRIPNHRTLWHAAPRPHRSGVSQR
ncbi:MAG: hypothetical protein NWR36_04270, partial [Opitutales bacterium]|nr:hypothetical protein [Opitutales bacterium]